MREQIHYLKQPLIVLKIIIGLAVVTLAATCAAGYYIRDKREWKSAAEYWYGQSRQSPAQNTKTRK